MQQHLFNKHLAGILHTQGDHGQAVANQNNIHAGMIGNVGAGEVMGSHHGDGLFLSMQTPQSTESNFLALVGGCSPHG